ncbi:hypothetical protein BDC45DRAFT_568305 [Circinella umbellata]|nr:hypothetical protein BDC45DRAFT_568305 [Circinella umbellata]
MRAIKAINLKMAPQRLLDVSGVMTLNIERSKSLYCLHLKPILSSSSGRMQAGLKKRSPDAVLYPFVALSLLLLWQLLIRFLPPPTAIAGTVPAGVRVGANSVNGAKSHRAPHKNHKNTVKILECATSLLVHQQLKYKNAFIETFKKLRVFSIHAIKNKITLSSTMLCDRHSWNHIELRSATIPSTWTNRLEVLKYFELLATLMAGLYDCEQTERQLDKERLGSVPFDGQSVHEFLGGDDEIENDDHKYTSEEIQKAANLFHLSRMDVLKAELRQTQQNKRYYRQQFDRGNKIYETLHDKVKELEPALTIRSTKQQHHFTTHSVLSVSLPPIAAKSTQPEKTLSPSQLILSTPAIIDTTTNVVVTPSARPPCTTMQPPNNNSACIQHSCVTNITEASKFFQFPHQNQTKFEYIYIPCLQRKTRQKIRQLSRSLKINTSRVVDISYPSRNIIGIPATNQHNASRIPTLKTFDPIHPENLKDLQYQICSEFERSNISKQSHHQRCLRAISAQPLTLITKIARFFNSKGWIDRSDFDHSMSSPRQL